MNDNFNNVNFRGAIAFGTDYPVGRGFPTPRPWNNFAPNPSGFGYNPNMQQGIEGLIRLLVTLLQQLQNPQYGPHGQNGHSHGGRGHHGSHGVMHPNRPHGSDSTDGSGGTLPEAGTSGFGDQSPVTATYNNNSTQLNGMSFSNDFLQDLYADFENSPANPRAQTMDLRTTPWGYQGSSSALTAFYNYVLDQYPTGQAQNDMPLEDSTYSSGNSYSLMRSAPEDYAVDSDVAASTSDTTSAQTASTTPLEAVVQAAVADDTSSSSSSTAASAAPGSTHAH